MIVNTVKTMYNNNFSSQVVSNNELTDSFTVTTWVKQGCILSPVHFLLGIDWVMKNVVNKQRRWIRWTLTNIIEYLDFADDNIALFSHRRQYMQANIDDIT